MLPKSLIWSGVSSMECLGRARRRQCLPIGRHSPPPGDVPPARKWCRAPLATALHIAFCGLLSFRVVGQNNPPPASYLRSYVNDIPNQPLVTVVVTGAVNVACLTIEEDVPPPATVLQVSGDGVYLPALNAIRWGPYINTTYTNVSYRITGLPAGYPVNGGSWMDGKWYFSPGATTVQVLSTNPVTLPNAPQQVATPTFTPASGAYVPVSVTITDATPGAEIYYTLDGSLPTQSSILYSGPIELSSVATVWAAAFENGLLPSTSVVAVYGVPAAPANVQVARSVNTSSPNAPVVTFTVTPGTNAGCVTLTETLPTGLWPAGITGGGAAGASPYQGGGNFVQWGPFFGTNVETLTYHPVGLPGVYPVRATWSVDGVDGGEADGTNLVIASGAFSPIPTPQPQVATPAFAPASGAYVPVSLMITDATPGAVIYYTLDGSIPTQNSTLYTGPIELSSAAIVWAVAFTNGWAPSESGVACYGSPATPADAQVLRSVSYGSPNAPVVAFTVAPGATAECVTVTEPLPAGLGAINISQGGNYVASQNAVMWGPFFGTNWLTLSYQAVGLPGTYPVRAAWSVDGVGALEPPGGSVTVAGPPLSGIPQPPLQEPGPILTPPLSSNFPVTVTITPLDSQGQIYYTTDGTLPTPNEGSTLPYLKPLTFAARTSLRALEARANYLNSVAVVGEYMPPMKTNEVATSFSIDGNGSFQPVVSLAVTPDASISCYAVVETVPFELTPADISGDGVWDALAGAILWGPYLDNQPRQFTFGLSGPSGTFSLAGQISFDGYSEAITNEPSVQINAEYTGSPPLTNLAACASDNLTYEVNLAPAPNVTVTSASGTVQWGDGTSSPFSQPNLALQHAYAVPGTYSIVLAADWTGYSGSAAESGQAARLDTVMVVTNCAPPQIVTEPSNVVALAGSTVQFFVSASSPVPMIYQWFFDEHAPIFSPSDFATLTLLDVTPQAQGTYLVVITNAFGSITSSVATLTVIAPVISAPIHNQNGSLTLSFTGLPNVSTRLWATTNLADPASWESIYTNTVTTPDGTWQYTDTNANQFLQRYYRFSTP